MKSGLRSLPAFFSTRRGAGALAVGLGVFWFWVAFNFYPLPLTHVRWIYASNSDSAQHQIGWIYFRNAPWGWPPGRIDALMAPQGTSIVYTDSIPLMALPFKLLSPLLRENAQYLGLWALICLLLQSYFGLRLLQDYGLNLPQRIAGASLLALSPVMIYRAWSHEALMAHWLLLAGFCLLRAQRRRALRPGAWAGLLALSVWVHAYFTAMLAPFALASWVWEALSPRPGAPALGRRLGRALLELALAAGAVGAAGWLAGLFVTGGAGLQGVADRFTLNLNSFINPLNTAAFLPARPLAIDTQYEGYAYLGAGLLALGAGVLWARFRSGFGLGPLWRAAPLWAPALLLAAFAAGSAPAFDGLTLWKLTLPGALQSLLAVFQASGRFIWPLYYLAVLAVLVQAVRVFRPAGLLLALALLVQLADLHPLIESKRFSGYASWESPLQGAFWEQAPSNFERVLLLPYTGDGPVQRAFALFAAEHNLSINWSSVARLDSARLNRDIRAAHDDLLGGAPDPRALYVLLDDEWLADLRASAGASAVILCRQAGVWLALPRGSPLVQAGSLPPGCAAP